MNRNQFKSVNQFIKETVNTFLSCRTFDSLDQENPRKRYYDDSRKLIKVLAAEIKILKS